MDKFIWGYILIINMAGFIQMGLDKKKAMEHKWRVKEVHLFAVAAAGGSVGSICGMQVFRHKTQHGKFIYGMPGILALQLILWSIIVFAK